MRLLCSLLDGGLGIADGVLVLLWSGRFPLDAVPSQWAECILHWRDFDVGHAAKEIGDQDLVRLGCGQFVRDTRMRVDQNGIVNVELHTFSMVLSLHSVDLPDPAWWPSRSC